MIFLIRRRKLKFLDPKILRRRTLESVIVDYTNWLFKTYKYEDLKEGNRNNLVLKVCGFMALQEELELPLTIEEDMSFHSVFSSGKGMYLFVYEGYWSLNLPKFRNGITEVEPYAVDGGNQRSMG